MGEAFVESSGGLLWTCRSGDGVPVALANGGPGCCDYLAPVGAMLHGLAATVRFEQRGCGRSSRADSYTLAQCIDDLDRIRAHYGFERWVVLGHSWGADLALAYALERPQRTLGLIGVAGGKIVDDREWKRTYQERREREGETEPDYRFEPNFDVNEQLVRDWRRYCRQPRLLARIAHLEVPALLLTAGDDIRPSWPTEQLAALLPRGEHRRIEGAAHFVWLSHARELERELRAFVTERSKENRGTPGRRSGL